MSSHPTTSESPRLCECGCGNPAPISRQTRRDRGQLQGFPVRFIRGHSSIPPDKPRPPLLLNPPPPRSVLPYRKPTLEERIRAKTQVSEGDNCGVWTGAKTRLGYGVLQIDGKKKFAHRVVWELAHGPLKPRECVCHHCDNPSCVRLSHLFIGPPKINTQDMWQKGRGRIPHYSGEKNNQAKLTEEAVRDIRARRGTTLQAVLAREYGVYQSTISFIQLRKSWKHIE